MSRRDERRYKWTGRKKYKQRDEKPKNYRLIWAAVIFIIIAGVGASNL
jgi:hypothetical protein